jgi:multiple sugar transport system ATP-binding protein
MQNAQKKEELLYKHTIPFFVGKLYNAEYQGRKIPKQTQEEESMASVSLQHIYKVYSGNVTAVSDFTLDIEDKEFIVLVGPSGCGKSTTLRMVAGLEEISDGELYIGDKLVNDVAPKDRDIAMVFQNYALYPHMTVFDNMAFGLKLRKTPKDEIKRRVEEAAKILDIAHLLNRKPKALSGGQRQRVALGRAIVREPKVFLFDEPLSNLDAKLRVAMRTEITKLHQRLQTTFIYVTHDQTEAMTMASRIVVMKDGVVQQVDTPQNLYDYPANEFVAGFIGSPQMNFFNVKLEREGQDVVAKFGDNKIIVPEKKIAKFSDESYIGKEVIMGIRPENIHDDEQKLAEYATATFDVDVEVTELMGSETYLYLSTTGKEGNIIARVDPRTSSKAGQKIKVAMDTTHLHFFDKETEKTILNK